MFLLLGMLGIIFFWPSIYDWAVPRKPLLIDTSWAVKMKKMEMAGDTTSDVVNFSENDKQEIFQYDLNASPGKSSLFYFDPNKITRQQWLQLGISEKTTATIQKYLSKGGSFKKPEDLKKIYGIRQADYERLLPYIQIASLEMKKTGDPFSDPDKKKNSYANSFTGNKNIDINTADTTAFIRLPGIGSKLAARIVTFRNKLGGFYSIEQIKETYGLADTVFQKIKAQLDVGNVPVRKININTATFDELRAHPYIKTDIGRQIVNYRKEHGNYTKAAELKKNPLITEDIYQQLSPYITTE